MALKEALLGTPGGIKQIPLGTPEQNQAVNSLLPLLQGRLQSNLASKDTFEPIAQQARRNFATQTVPSLAERFSAMGSNRGSSGLIGSLGAAGADLDSNLAALKAQYGLQEQGNLNSLLNTLLSPQFQNLNIPSQPGFLEATAPYAAKGLLGGLGGGSSAGDLAGLGLSGALTGAGIGAAAGPLGAAIGGGVGATAPFWKWLIDKFNSRNQAKGTLGIQGGNQ